MQLNNLYYESNDPGVTRRQFYTLRASSLRYLAVFDVLNSLEFLCLVICKLMLLGRLANSATHSSQAEVTEMSGVRRRWLSGRALPNVYRVMAGAVVVGSAVGMVANTAAGAYYVRTAVLADQAASACDSAGNDTNSSLTLANTFSGIETKEGACQSVQLCSEALTLLLVSVAYFAIVSWSVATCGRLRRMRRGSLRMRCKLQRSSDGP
jgi:hypothetical protein